MSDKNQPDGTLLEEMLDALNRFVQPTPTEIKDKKRSVVVRALFVRLAAAQHVCAAALGYIEALCGLIGMSQTHIQACRADGMAHGMRIILSSGKQSIRSSVERLAPLLEQLHRLEATNAKPKKGTPQGREEEEASLPHPDRSVPSGDPDHKHPDP